MLTSFPPATLHILDRNDYAHPTDSRFDTRLPIAIELPDGSIVVSRTSGQAKLVNILSGEAMDQ